MTSTRRRSRVLTCLVSAAVACATSLGALSSSAAATVIVVTNTADGGPGSLRAAIELSNTTPGSNTIVFAIPATDPGFDGQWFTIKPLSPLPALTDDGTTVDGRSQTAFTGDTNTAGPEVFLDGQDQAEGHAFRVQSSGNVIEGLTLSGFPYQAILIQPHSATPLSGNVVRGNYIGTDPTGQSAIPNGTRFPFGPIPALSVGMGVDTVIGGTAPGDGNLVSGNFSFGIDIVIGSRRTIVQGNRVGTDATGTRALPNGGHGINLGEFGGATFDNVIGGTAPGAGNLISGNDGDGIFVAGSGHVIQGNLIGTNADGSASIPNRRSGIRFVRATDLQVGGTSPAARNVISGNSQSGIALGDSSTDNVIEGNFIGTNASGTAALGNRGNGVTTSSGPLRIGGTTPGAGNLISGNRGFKGAVLAFDMSGLTIQGNLVGTDAAGTSAIPNAGPGLDLFKVTDALVGGTGGTARNLISGNGGSGISIGGDGGSTRVVVQGNYIGTDITGTAALGNRAQGVSVGGASANVVGGTGAGEGNLISGNVRAGVFISAPAQFPTSANVVQGNLIGTDVTGASALPNGSDGVHLDGDGVVGTRIGGTAPGSRNVISGNGHDGVAIGLPGLFGRPRDTIVQGNLIGTDRSGTRAIPNGTNPTPENSNPQGVRINGGRTLVGGTTPSARNVISGNTAAGVWLGRGAHESVIQGNFIGTDSSGSSAIPNGGGIAFKIHCGDPDCVPTDTLIGGSTPGAGNLISGNRSGGIGLAGIRTRAEGNLIGTDVTGSAALPNGGPGVSVNFVCGLEDCRGDLSGNTIAFNNGPGIGNGNDRAAFRISRNSIFSNAGLGIDLGSGGVTPNDPGDADTGPNGLQNFPVLIRAQVTPGALLVIGRIDTPDPARVTIELFANAVPSPGGDPSGHGEGAVFLGTATPNPGGVFVATLPSVPEGTLITATATDAAGNTSEFAANIPARAPGPP